MLSVPNPLLDPPSLITFPGNEWRIPFLMTIYYFIFAIIWLLWRSNPLAHRTGLIATGILGLRSAGFIPGLLVLIAGIIAPKKET